jgi:hypothetical protein
MTRYAIVPVEATKQMKDAAWNESVKSWDDGYSKMLAAAPSPLEDAELMERVKNSVLEVLPYDGFEDVELSRRIARAAIAAIGGK